MLEAARKLKSAGLSPIPISEERDEHGDLVKRPEGKVLPMEPDPKTGEMKPSWKPFQTRQPTDEELDTFFANGAILGCACGAGSGNLEVIDFDELGLFEKWKALIDPALFARLGVIQTPSGGHHVWFRLDFEPPGNKVLARTARNKTAIETRGQGGYVLCYPSPGYKWIQGKPSTIPVLTKDERFDLIDAAGEFHEGVFQVHDHTKGQNPSIMRPGDRYAHEHSWDEILEGWTETGHSGENTFYARPGKTRGKSGSVKGEVFYCYTSNAYPLEPMHAYSKFTFYAAMHHGGDLFMAAQALGKEQRRPGMVPKPSKIRPELLDPEDDDCPFRKFEEDDFRAVVMSYLWKPYFPIGKAVLVDADGGIGKSSLALAIAACLSQGMTPMTFEPCEPVRTLFIGHTEDDDEELETVYRACDGRPGWITYNQEGLMFNEDMFEDLGMRVRETGERFIVFDGIFDFMSIGGRPANPNDPVQMAAMMGLLGRFAARNRVTAFASRHTSKSTEGKAESNLGIGSAMIRNKARGQLLLRWHKNKEMYRGVVVATDMRGSILRQPGAPFAFKRKHNAVEWLPDMDLTDYTEGAEQKRGPTPEALTEACAFLEKQLIDGPKMSADLVQLADGKISQPTLYRAKTHMGLTTSKGLWRLPDGYDPYSDEAPHWAGLS